MSVVIPTHNRSRWLRDAIESVLAQTWTKLELVVVDDASQDDTRETVASFKDSRIRYFRNEKNSGVAATRNRGVRESLGSWIALLDDDDQWFPEKLAKQMALIDVSPRPGVIYSGALKVDRVQGTTTGMWRPTHRGNLSEPLRFGCSLGPGASTALISRECFDRVGLFDENLPFAADYDLWIRIARFFPFEYVDEPLIRLGVHSQSLSYDWPNWTTKIPPLLEKYRDYFAPNLNAAYLLAIGTSLAMSGDTRGARKAFRSAIVAEPGCVRAYPHFALCLLGPAVYRRVRDLLHLS